MTPKPLKVTLLSYPANTLPMLFYVWEQSRHDRPLPSVEAIAEAVDFSKYPLNVAKVQQSVEATLKLLGYELEAPGIHGEIIYWERVWEASKKFKTYYDDIVSKLFDEAVPVLDHLEFVFEIEEIPIALREQMVRHRVGAKVGPRIGADIVPDLAQSAWWAQSHRVLDMSRFLADGHFHVPDTIKGNQTLTSVTKQVPMPASMLDRGQEYVMEDVPMTVEETYLGVLKVIQNAYNALVEAGVPREDARELIPLGTTHRTSWAINTMALKHIIGKRSCWILQRGLWESLVLGMVEELATKVHPAFRKLVTPPCIKGEKWVGCPFALTNQERIQGRDLVPPCPLFLAHNRTASIEASRAVPNPKWMIRGDDYIPADECGPAGYDGIGPDGTATGPQFPGGWVTKQGDQATQMVREREGFRRLWGRDVDTGQLLEA